MAKDGKMLSREEFVRAVGLSKNTSSKYLVERFGLRPAKSIGGRILLFSACDVPFVREMKGKHMEGTPVEKKTAMVFPTTFTHKDRLLLVEMRDILRSLVAAKKVTVQDV